MEIFQINRHDVIHIKVVCGLGGAMKERSRSWGKPQKVDLSPPGHPQCVGSRKQARFLVTLVAEGLTLSLPVVLMHLVS